MIDRLIARLQQDFELTAEEIADILLLTVIQHQEIGAVATEIQEVATENKAIASGESRSQIDLTNTHGDDPTHIHRNTVESDQLDRRLPFMDGDSVSKFPSTPEETIPSVEIHPPQKPSQVQIEAASSLPFPTPDAPTLRGIPALVRALQPLQQRVASSVVSLLDEAATAQRIAETQIWLPALQPDLEPWLDLVLIVDSSPSMLIWQRTVREFERLLRQYGFFRDVRTWSLAVEQGQVCLRPGLHPIASQAVHNPKEILDPKNRRLILLMSDCVSEMWQTRIISEALSVWAAHEPMALVQVLPEWLWDRTALRQVPTARLYSYEPGTANRNLKAIRRDRWRDPTPTDIKLPVFTLEPEVIYTWSQMVANKDSGGAPGFIFPKEQSEALSPSAQLDPQQRIQRFRVFASPMARRLAGLLSAAPVITLPVIRLIREAKLRQSQQVHVAEVLLGGLLKPTEPITATTKTDEVRYEFYDAVVRRSLQEETPAFKMVEVLTQLIRQRFDESLEQFIAALYAPDLKDSSSEAQDERDCFAQVAIDILKRRGGRYAEFAKEIEQKYSEELPPEPPTREPTDGWQTFAVTTVIELRTMEFEAVTVTVGTEPSRNLQPFTFEVATIATEPIQELDAAEQIRNASDIEEAIQWADRLVGEQTERSLTNTQKAVLHGAWQNQTYEQMAQALGQSEAYLRREVGPELWRLISEAVGEKITKTNSRSLLQPRQPYLKIDRREQQGWQFVEDLGNEITLELVSVPGGRFLMGSPGAEVERLDTERPQHEVTIAPFLIGKYPVTQAQWRVVAAMPPVNRELNPAPSCFEGNNRPVECVSWWDVVEFCDRLSRKTGRVYRLPSEAEWEYACRAGTTTPFHFGKTITTDLANYDGNYTYGSGVKGTYRRKTTSVGSFKVANAFGLYDMHGNVWEWCADQWHENYRGAPDDGSVWLFENEDLSRVLRGGSWYGISGYCRSAYRDGRYSDYRSSSIGFRVLCPAARIL